MASEGDNYIYIGPNAGLLGLKKATLYRGPEMPVQLKNLVQTKPIIASLFVPTARTAVTEANMKKQGTVEYLAVQEIVKIVREIKQRK